MPLLLHGLYTILLTIFMRTAIAAWNLLLCPIVYDNSGALNLLGTLAEKAHWIFYVASHLDALDNSSHSHSNLIELILSIYMIAQRLLLSS